MSNIKISPPIDNAQPPVIPELFYSANRKYLGQNVWRQPTILKDFVQFFQINREASLVSASQPTLDSGSMITLWWQRLNHRRLTRMGLWLLGLTCLILWARWHGVLLLSTAGGIGTMIGVYRLPRHNWQRYWSQFSQLFSRSNRALTLAVASGGLVSVATYWIVSLLLSCDNVWVALSLILQNCGILAIAGLILWQFLRQRNRLDQAYSDRLLTELTDDNALQRLIAVRKLTQFVLRASDRCATGTASSLTRSQLAECFRLMLRNEPEPLVRNGLLDGLQQLD